MKRTSKIATVGLATVIASVTLTGVATAAPDRQVRMVSEIPEWATAINWASTKLDVPYVWGGDSDADGGYDCSGLTMRAYEKAGIKIPRVANDQWNASRNHPKKHELLPGDLVFYGQKGNSRSIHHVGIYVGSGYMLHAPKRGTVIRFDKIDYMKGYFGATRVAQW